MLQNFLRKDEGITSFTLIWVLEHFNVADNEITDLLAKFEAQFRNK